MQNGVQGRGPIGSHNQAPYPAPLLEETRTRRHAHSLQTRPPGPRPARPDNDARRPESREVKFRSLTEHIDTDTVTAAPLGRMIGLLAELERSLISERTRAGVTAASGGE